MRPVGIGQTGSSRVHLEQSCRYCREQAGVNFLEQAASSWGQRYEAQEIGSRVSRAAMPRLYPQGRVT